MGLQVGFQQYFEHFDDVFLLSIVVDDRFVNEALGANLGKPAVSSSMSMIVRMCARLFFKITWNAGIHSTVHFPTRTSWGDNDHPAGSEAAGTKRPLESRLRHTVLIGYTES